MAMESSIRGTNCMNAIDTNVLVYYLDATEPVKQAKAQHLYERLSQPPIDTLLLWQVAGEWLNRLRKWQAAKRITASDVESYYRDLLKVFPLVIPSAAAFATYFDLYSRFSLSHWDAMLLAACKDAGVTTLYSEDLDAATDYDGVSVANPFA
jgi:predicted nucleic acid-binding protein